MSDDFYRAVLEHAPFGAIVASTAMDGRCLYLNPEFTRTTGYDLDDIPTVQDWIERAYPDPEYRALVVRNWETDTTPDQMNRDVLYRVTCKDGATRTVQFRARMVETSRMIVMLLDVTRRERAEQALRDSEERYRALVESSPQGIVLHAGGTIDFANAAALRIMGAGDPAELRGRPVLDFVHPEWRQAVIQRVQGVLEQGTPAATEVERWIRLDGRVIDVEVAGGPVQFQGQRASQVIFSDITDRKRLEREQQALQRQMQRAQRTESLALLAGGVAHDLNNLLVGILGHAELARRATATTAALDQHLAAVVETSERAADLAGQLLAYAGRRRLEYERVDLDTLVGDTRRLLDATVGGRAELRLELAGDLPALEGDATQLRQILLNLVTNAAEALQDQGGHITVTTGALASDDPRVARAYSPAIPADRVHLLLQVTDDGPGLDAATRERVFDPFFTTKATGRGLGLAAALGIVRAHHGALSVQSEPGAGARFRVLFPATGGAAPARTDRGAEERWQGQGVALLVDDEQVVLDVGASMLREVGFEVVLAHNGPEALALVEQDPAQLTCVILDLTMPGPSGAETFLGIRALREDLPVILSSGFDEADTAHRFGEHKPAGFLQKPYKLATLVRILRGALG